MRVLALLATLLAAVWGCAPGAVPASPVASTPPTVSARAWPEADLLFKRDPHWLGGDAAVSVGLDSERVLWLFGDSFIARSDAATRGHAVFVRNSIALQRGVDPTRAELRFYTGTGADATPRSFFPEDGASWFWPGHGVFLDHQLTLFLERMSADSGPGSLGFRASGWIAVRVRDCSGEPASWRVERLQTPDTGELHIVGAAVLLEGPHVYAFAVREPGDHAIMLMRWARRAFADGELLRPEYWGGTQRGWTNDAPAVVIDEGATEFSVSHAPHGGFVEVQSRGFGAAPIALRFAKTLTGPWSPASDAYRPEQAREPGILLYAARAHPELEGAGMLVTYASNSLDHARLLDDLTLYFPRFVRLELQ
jgi:hypothetical protein